MYTAQVTILVYLSKANPLFMNRKFYFKIMLSIHEKNMLSARLYKYGLKNGM